MRAFRNLFYKPVKIIAKTAGVPVVKKKNPIRKSARAEPAPRLPTTAIRFVPAY